MTDLNKKLCAECGGSCCKRQPCHVFPRDLGVITKDKILKKLKEGFVFDSWDGDFENKKARYDQSFFMRGRALNDNEGYYTASWGGVCIHLTPTGCKFSDKDRPSGGRGLVAREKSKGGCYVKKGYSKEDCAKAWEKYHKIVEEIINNK